MLAVHAACLPDVNLMIQAAGSSNVTYIEVGGRYSLLLDIFGCKNEQPLQHCEGSMRAFTTSAITMSKRVSQYSHT